MRKSSPDPVGLSPELVAQNELYLRLAADFDNFKKRTRRDAERQDAAGKEEILLELLPTLDNLERALASASATSVDPLCAGVTLTLQQLGQLLHQHGIDASDDQGQPFDPHRHEAVSARTDPDQPDQVILDVLQRGYCRGDTVFRPAKVAINDLGHKPGPLDAS